MQKSISIICFLFCINSYINGQTIVVGTFTDTTIGVENKPFSANEEAYRFQMLYKASEINALGVTGPIWLESIGYFFTQVTSSDFNNFSIKVKHTSATDVWSHDIGPFEEVYNSPLIDSITVGGVYSLNFDESFLWNGTDNLLFDICYSLSSFPDSSTKMISSALPYFSHRWGSNSAGTSCNMTTGVVHTNRPTMQMVFSSVQNIDAGVSEFQLPNWETSSGANDITVELSNYGNNVLNSTDIFFSVNGGAPSVYNWLGSLNSGSKASVYLGTLLFTEGLNDLKIWTSNPNSSLDQNNQNDTLYKTRFVKVDVGISSTEVPFDVCDGLQSVDVRLKNFGSDTLATVNIPWNVNSIPQTLFNWSGNLSPGDSVLVHLGDVSLNYGMPYLFEFWTESPNSFIDINEGNDTLVFLTDTTRLHGDYTVGGTTPDFYTIQGALDTLEISGICDSTTLLIRPGTYTEFVTFPYVKGTSPLNRLVITSESMDSSSVVIQEVPAWNGYLSTMDSAVYTTIQFLTFETLSTNPSGCLKSLYAEDCEINYCSFKRHQYPYVYTVDFGGKDCNMRNNKVEGSLSFSAGWGSYFSPGTMSTFEYNYVVGGGVVVDGYWVKFHHNDVEYVPSRASKVYIDDLYRLDLKYNKFDNNTDLALEIVSVGDTGYTSVIANNYIHGRIDIDQGHRIAFTHNTAIQSGSSSASVISLDNLNKFWMKNNILLNYSPSGRVLYYPDLIGTEDSIDNNIYYCLGSFMYYNTSYITDFSSFVGSANQNDVNSLFQDVVFDVGNEPHTNDFSVYGGGVSYGSVLDDIDGEMRANPPCIGADEIVPLSDQVRIMSIEIDSANCSGTQNIYGIFQNIGLNDLMSFSIEYEINGVPQTSFDWTGNISIGDTIPAIIIGQVNLNTGVQTDVKAWTTLPNGQVVVPVDTVGINTVPLGLSGTYIVGSGGDFLTIQQAVDTAMLRGICGEVIFSVLPGTYSGGLDIGFIPGASELGNLIITSNLQDSSTVNIYNTSYPTVEFNNSAYVTLDQLTIEVASTSSVASHVKFIGATHDITVSNCHIDHTNNAIGITNGTSTPHYGLMIKNNYIKTEGIGIDLNGSNNDHSYRNSILNNTFLDQERNVIDVWYNDSLIISGNDFSTFITTYTGARDMIYVVYTDSSLEITNNRFNSSHSTAIKLELIDGGVNDGVRVANNQISLIGAGGTGIALTDVFNSLIGFNSTRIECTASYSVPLYVSYGCEGNTILNNIFANFGTGTALNIRGLNNQMDYNAFYSTDSLKFRNSGLYYLDLTAWQTAFSLEANSIFTPPQFLSSSDLHINNDALLNNAASPISSIVVDYDNETRDAVNPDIGSDEFVFIPPAIDAKVSELLTEHVNCLGTDSIYAVIRNLGVNPLTSLDIVLEVNNNTLPSYSWNGSLSYLETDTIMILSQYFDSTYVVRAWSNMPNGIADPYPFNDTSGSYYINPSMVGTYTVAGNNPDFSSLQEALTLLEDKGVCGPVVLNIRPGIYGNVVFNHIPGLSYTNNLTVQSETLDTADVIFTQISMHNISNVHFNYLTIEHTGNSYALDLEIFEDFEVKSCHILGEIWYDGDSLNHMLFENCLIEGKLSIYPNNGFDVNFHNNIIQSIFENKIHSVDSLVLEHNRFFDLSGQYDPSDILLYLEGCGPRGRVSRNYLKGSTFDLMLVNGCDGTASNPFMIDNNSFFTGEHGNYGLVRISNGEHIYFVHNCIDWQGVNYGLQIVSGTTVRNNIINAPIGHPVYYGTYPFADADIDRNVYYSTLSELMSIELVDYTLSDWTNLTTWDSNSVILDPQFFSLDSLQYTNPLLEDLGVPIATVDYDILNNQRSLTAPDPGCYEQNLVSVSESSLFAGVEIIVFPNPVMDGQVNLKIISNNNLENITYQVISLSGEIVFQGGLNFEGLTGSAMIDLNHIANGSYVLEIHSSKEKVCTEKLILLK